MKRIVLLLSVLSVMMLIGCGSKKEEGETKEITYNKIQVQFHNDYMDITDEKDINTLAYIFDETNWVEEKFEEERYGWIYALTGYDVDGNTKKVVIINDEYLNCGDKYYKISKEGTVQLIDEISGFDRYAVGVEEETTTEETTTVEHQTGYPDGEVQWKYVMYNDILYTHDYAYKRHIDENEVISKFEGYEKIGTVNIDNLNMPDEELDASRFEEGATLYAKSGYDSEVYVYSVDTLYRMIPYKD